MLQGILPHVHAVHQDLSLIRIVQPGDHGYQRGLSAARGTDDSHGLAGLDAQRDIVQHLFPAVLIIPEGHVLKLDASLFHQLFLLRRGFVRQIDPRVQHLVDPPRAGNGAGALQKYHGEHHQRHEHLHDIGGKGRQVSNGHVADQHLPSSQPYHGQGGQIHEKSHQRHLQDDHFKGPQAGFHQFFIGFQKALFLMIPAHEGLDHPHVLQALLNVGVHPVQLLLHEGESGEGGEHDRRDGDHHDRQDHKKDPRKPRVHGRRHDDRTDQHARRAQHHAQSHHDQVLHLRDIIGQPGHERARGKAVDVAEGKLLHLLKAVVSQIRAEADGRLGREPGSADSAAHHHKGGEDHHSPHFQNIGHIPVRRAHVDDLRHQRRQHHLSHHLGDHQDRPEDERIKIGPCIFPVSFHSSLHKLCHHTN